MRYVVLSLFIVLLCSCNMITVDKNWYDLSEIPIELQIYSDIMDEHIFNYAVNSTKYEFYANGFHPVQRTYEEKKGNCANITLLILALQYKITGVKGQLVYCTSMFTGVETLHYSPRINGKMRDTSVIRIYDIIEFDNIAEYIYYRQ